MKVVGSEIALVQNLDGQAASGDSVRNDQLDQHMNQIVSFLFLSTLS